MRVFHVAPKYLDNSTLYAEYGLLMELFKKITKADPIQQDRLYWKFESHTKYIFYRLLIVAEEMENRDLETDIDLLKMMDIASIESKDYDITIKDINLDVEYLTKLWDEDQTYDPSLPNYLEKLALSNSEQLLLEVQFLFSQYEDEYGV